MSSTMRLNTISPAEGAKSAPKRVGRGPGSGLGKTCGRGVKGQKSRSGGFHKVGFEGGQMPLQRRLPKRGFRSRVNNHHVELRLNELCLVEGNEVTLETLMAADLVRNDVLSVKVMLSGEVTRALTLRGIRVTKGAKAAIEAAGGSVEG